MKLLNYRVRFHDKIVLRTPAYPLNDIHDVETLLKFCDDPSFKEGLLLASPDLNNRIDKITKGIVKSEEDEKRIINSIYRYWNRACTRCIPFGLFAGCGVVDWGDETSLENLNTFTGILRKSRVDMGLLFLIIKHIENTEEIRNQILFYPNPTIYSFNQKYRYVEYYLKTHKIYFLSSIEKSDYLELILEVASKGIKMDELAGVLLKKYPDFSLEEVNEFIESIIDSQILVHDLNPSLTSAIPPLTQLVNNLKKLPKGSSVLQNNIDFIGSLSNLISNLDHTPHNNISSYHEIFAKVDELEIEYVKKKVVQVDMHKTFESTPTLDKKLQKKLLEAVELLLSLNNRGKHKMDSFIEEFYERYEHQEAPLVEVLDPESGFKYGSVRVANEYSTLLKDISRYKKEKTKSTLDVYKSDVLLFNLLLEATKKEESEIELSEEFVQKIKEVASKMDRTKFDLPDSMSILFSIYEYSNKDPKIFLHPSGLASAINLLGRFTSSNDDILSIVKDIASFENQNTPKMHRAEVIHLGQNREGNITAHPAFRKYEIPYLAKSSVEDDFLIPVNDIMVSISSNRKEVILRSKKLNIRIMPTKSSAHNSYINVLPIYHFLSDMYDYNTNNRLVFGWGALSTYFKFVPRVTYKGIILHRAIWHMNRDDINSILKGDVSVEKVNIWRKQFKIPTKVAITKGDQELTVDFNNPLSVDMFVDMVKKQKSCTLTEFLFSDNENHIVKDVDNGCYVNQFMATLLIEKNEQKERSVPEKKTIENINLSAITRNYPVGSEWIYYKIYCGNNVSNELLIGKIRSLVEECYSEDLVKNWFFIRYLDPKPHIRLRFRVKDLKLLQTLMTKVYNCFLDEIESGTINDLQVHTYKREIERYGTSTMELSEKWFEMDSNNIVHLLAEIDEIENEDIVWLTALSNMDSILNSFGFSLIEKEKISLELSNQYLLEIDSNKKIRKEIDLKFRKYADFIFRWLNKEVKTEYESTLLNIIKKNEAKTLPIFEEIRKVYDQKENSVPLRFLISSYIHMSINRMFISEQRYQELVLYRMLNKHYKSKIGREKY